MVVGALGTHLPLLFPLAVILGVKRCSIWSLPWVRMQDVAKKEMTFVKKIQLAVNNV